MFFAGSCPSSPILTRTNLLSAREPPPPIPRAAVCVGRTRWTDPERRPDNDLLFSIGAGNTPYARGPLYSSIRGKENRSQQKKGNRQALEIDAVRRQALHNNRKRSRKISSAGCCDECGPVWCRLWTALGHESQRSRTTIKGLSLVTLGGDLRVFTVPQIQWEPVWTIQRPDPNIVTVFPSPLASADDGGPTLLGMRSVKLVPIAPRPLVMSLASEFRGEDPSGDFFAAALFALPFGMCAVGCSAGSARAGDARCRVKSHSAPQRRVAGGRRSPGEPHGD